MRAGCRLPALLSALCFALLASPAQGVLSRGEALGPSPRLLLSTPAALPLAARASSRLPVRTRDDTGTGSLTVTVVALAQMTAALG